MLRWIARKACQEMGLALNANGLIRCKREIVCQRLMDLGGYICFSRRQEDSQRIGAVGLDMRVVYRFSQPLQELSSGRAPLLAPSPLRTGLEGFPFIRLEHPKTPP